MYSNIEIIGSVFEKEDTEPDYEELFNQLNVDKLQKTKVKVRKLKSKSVAFHKHILFQISYQMLLITNAFFLDKNSLIVEKEILKWTL